MDGSRSCSTSTRTMRVCPWFRERKALGCATGDADEPVEEYAHTSSAGAADFEVSLVEPPEH